MSDPKAPAYISLAIYDDVLPSPASPFRTLEYEHYLNFFSSSVLISLEAWHYGFAHAGFGDLRGQLPIKQELKDRIFDHTIADEIVPKLAYVTFLGNAQRLFPYFKERRIPFVLQLYPGGSFEPNVKKSDEYLRQIVRSPLCRKVIATQTLTREHLLNKIGCAPGKIEFIYGGVFDSRVGFDFDRDKRLYGKHKDTIDICFVAHRYGDDMAQKGYDQFVEIAQLLCTHDPRLRFHVVGDYRPEDIALGVAASRFTFHGTQPSEFFAHFYPSMDVILSANQPASVQSGAFDGFPTGACMEAGFRGVLNCVNDPLSLNVVFKDEQDIVLIDRDASNTARRLRSFFSEPDRLYAIAKANWEKFRAVFDVDRQLWARTQLITNELLREEVLITRPAGALSALEYVEEAARIEVEARHATLIEEYAKLKEALDFANEYGNRRHDALFVEYQKVASGYEAGRLENQAFRAEIVNLRTEIAEINARLALASAQSATSNLPPLELEKAPSPALSPTSDQTTKRLFNVFRFGRRERK